MDVKQAVAQAKQHIIELFADEDPTNIGLEEVEFNDQAKEWIVTIGFSRPWDRPQNALAALASSSYSHRAYKIVRISDGSDRIRSVKNREMKT